MSLVIIGLVAVAISAMVLAGLSVRTARCERGNLGWAMTHDHVTGLLSRDGLPALLDSVRGSNRPGHVAVVALEVDKLDSVNRTYGHEVGNALLMAITNQLENALSADEQIVRFAGSQFIVVCPGITDTAQAVERAGDFDKAVGIAFKIGVDQIRITPRIGVTIDKTGDEDPESLVSDALLASAASDRDGAVTLFELSMRSRLSQILTEQRLHAALDNGEFWLLYLPVIETDTNKIVGFEALLRWADPNRGLVPPSDFLDVLERTGLIIPVGAWVIDEACRQAAAWEQQFPGRGLITTLNISRSQLLHADFFDTLTHAATSAAISPENICLEVAEEVLTTNTDVAWTVLRRVKDAGFKLAIDDFGVGFSSLANLRHFKVDILKVGRAFIDRIDDNRENEAIVQQLVALAHALEVVPVAEGVETEAQLITLRSLRCDFAQGYLFSKPEPPATIDKLLSKVTIKPGTGRRSIDWSGS